MGEMPTPPATLLEAEDLDAAPELAKGHPHVDIPGCWQHRGPRGRSLPEHV